MSSKPVKLLFIVGKPKLIRVHDLVTANPVHWAIELTGATIFRKQVPIKAQTADS